jgi:hypothetical protein
MRDVQFGYPQAVSGFAIVAMSMAELFQVLRKYNSGDPVDLAQLFTDVPPQS